MRNNIEVSKMDKALIEKYKAEMFDLYRKHKKRLAKRPDSEVKPMPPAEEASPEEDSVLPDGMGKLVVMVTTLRSSFPLENAKVTVFIGDLESMQIVETDFTDESGKTKEFVLKTTSRMLSMTSNPDGKPYTNYNIEVKAEGYCDSVYLNVPIFSGVTSIQQANMLLLEAAGKGCPLVVDRSQQYTLGDA